jgi:hypothetical protein
MSTVPPPRDGLVEGVALWAPQALVLGRPTKSASECRDVRRLGE